MFNKICAYFISLMVALSIASLPAAAIQSPSGCNSNRLTLTLSRDKITVKQGDTLTYTVSLSNVNSGSNLACDIDTATVTLTLPALDGTPTGQIITLTTTGNYPAGTTPTIIGTVPYVVNVNDGVVDASAEAEVTGTLHDAPLDHAAQISKTIGTTVLPNDITPPEDSSSTIPTTSPKLPTSTPLPGMPNTASAS